MGRLRGKALQLVQVLVAVIRAVEGDAVGVHDRTGHLGGEGSDLRIRFFGRGECLFSGSTRRNEAPLGKEGIVDRIGISRGGMNAGLGPTVEEAGGAPVPEGKVGEDGGHGPAVSERAREVRVAGALDEGA